MSIDELYYDAVDLLKAMISMPSASGEEDEVARLLYDTMSLQGLNPHREANNVWSIAPGFDIGKPTLLLNAHLDTVRAGEGWTHDPFTPIVDEGRLYGLGSNDDGASVVTLLAAYRMLCDQDRAYNLIFMASAEEEVSGKNGIEHVLPLLPPIAVALVGEPTGMEPAVCEKGLMVLDGVVRGIAGHVARDEGENAIYKAFEVVDTLRNLRFLEESELLGPVKVTVAQISGGRQHNVVPDRCELLIDVRTTDAYTNEETLELLRQAVPQCELSPHSTRLNPSRIALDHPLVRRAVLLGKTPFGSPTLSDQALMPFPSLKMGPGDSARSHTADEYVTLDELREAIETYVVMLSGLTL